MLLNCNSCMVLNFLIFCNNIFYNYWKKISACLLYTSQQKALKEEAAALEATQFAGLDVERMQERLVELSRRYDETAQDARGEAAEQQKELHALREKLVRRQAEQYQSKYTKPLAELSAKVRELGAHYQRESAIYKAFHAGMECPTCHRSVTEQTLPEVQTAIKKTLSEMYAAGTEQRNQPVSYTHLDVYKRQG